MIERPREDECSIACFIIYLSFLPQTEATVNILSVASMEEIEGQSSLEFGWNSHGNLVLVQVLTYYHSLSLSLICYIALKLFFLLM